MRVLVYIHGACQHSAGYSDPWFAALKPWTDAYGDGVLGQTRFEILWSDLITHQGGVLGCLEDFFDYLNYPSVQTSLMHRFTKTMTPLFNAGHDIDLIAHSEGTVIAYKSLLGQWFIPDAWRRIVNFFTLGSVLGFQYGPSVSDNVRDKLFPGQRTMGKPYSVLHWWNLVAQGDPFGSVLAPAYGVDADFWNLPSPGCGLDPLCAHGSYFESDNVTVNRDIIAAKINEAA